MREPFSFRSVLVVVGVGRVALLVRSDERVARSVARAERERDGCIVSQVLVEAQQTDQRVGIGTADVAAGLIELEFLRQLCVAACAESGRVVGAGTQGDEVRDGDQGQDADDGHDDHELDQGETFAHLISSLTVFVWRHRTQTLFNRNSLQFESQFAIIRFIHNNQVVNRCRLSKMAMAGRLVTIFVVK